MKKKYVFVKKENRRESETSQNQQQQLGKQIFIFMLKIAQSMHTKWNEK